MTPLKYTLAILIIVCLPILMFSFIHRGKLCELYIRGENQEVVAKLACSLG